MRRDLKTVEYFTPAEVASVCCCAPRTVSKWIDSGVIEGFRLPAGRHRRVSRGVLVKFLAASGYAAALEKIGAGPQP